MPTFGRRTIYTGYSQITADNVMNVINESYQLHLMNAGEINDLLNYEKGDQPILRRIKEVRPEINEQVVENHATQIVNFWESYVFGSPIRYVQKADKQTDNETPDKDDSYIAALNEMCFEQNKPVKDQELAKMFLTCGVGYRCALPVATYDKNSDYSPFDIINLDPRTTYIIYSSDVYHRPLAGVTFWVERKNDTHTELVHHTVYTENKIYEFTGNDPYGMSISDNPLGIIPIVEYRQDYEKMGCFERVTELMDAINVATSDRVNAMAQFVQSFLWFDNVDIDTDTFQDLRVHGGFVTESKDGVQANIKLIESTLNQTEVQTLSEYLYSQLLQICSMPSRQAQSGSTTGQSSMLAGGWQEAEENAHRLEQMFDEGEKKFLKVVKVILDKVDNPVRGHINLRDIDIQFSRNKISNMLVKTQGLLNMKSFGIHPRIAIQTSGLFTDPQEVYNDSKEYVEAAYASEHPSGDVKDLQSNPQGDDASKVTGTQNEQMEFLSK